MGDRPRECPASPFRSPSLAGIQPIALSDGASVRSPGATSRPPPASTNRAERGDLAGRQPIDVGQHDDALTPERAGGELPGRDDPGTDLRRVVAGRGQRRAEEVGLAAEGLRRRARRRPGARASRRRDLDGDVGLVVAGECVAAVEPDGQQVRARRRRARSGTTAARGRPPGSARPTCAEPATGRPSTSNSAVRDSGPGPALSTSVVTATGRPGVTSARETASGPTEPLGVSGGFAAAEGDRPDARRDREPAVQVADQRPAARLARPPGVPLAVGQDDHVAAGVAGPLQHAERLGQRGREVARALRGRVMRRPAPRRPCAGSKLGGSTSGRTASPATRTATESPGRSCATNCRAHARPGRAGSCRRSRRSMLAEPSITSTTSRGGASRPSPVADVADPPPRASRTAGPGPAPPAPAGAIRASIRSSSVRRILCRARWPSVEELHRAPVDHRVAAAVEQVDDHRQGGPAEQPRSIAALRTPQVTRQPPRRDRDDR